MVEFHEWLRQELFKRNLSQKEFAGMINATQGIVSRYLSGKDMPSAITLIKIAKAFDLPESEILLRGGYDEKYKRIPKSTIAQPQIEEFTHESININGINKELLELAKHFDQAFLDKFGELDEEEKSDIIDMMKYWIERKREKERKEK